MDPNDKIFVRYVGREGDRILLAPGGPGETMWATRESLTAARLTLSGDFEVTALAEYTTRGSPPRTAVVPRETMALALRLLGEETREIVRVPPRRIVPMLNPTRPVPEEEEAPPPPPVPSHMVRTSDGSSDPTSPFLVTYLWTDPRSQDESVPPSEVTVNATSEQEALRKAHVEIRDAVEDRSYRILALSRL